MKLQEQNKHDPNQKLKDLSKNEINFINFILDKNNDHINQTQHPLSGSIQQYHYKQKVKKQGKNQSVEGIP